MNPIEFLKPSGMACPCNYLFDEQINFTNNNHNKLINEEAPFCYRCKKCDFHCQHNYKCGELKQKLIQLEEEMQLNNQLETDYKETISNLEFNIKKLKEYDPKLSEEFLATIVYLVENGKKNNDIIMKVSNDLKNAIKYIVQMKQNKQIKQLCEVDLHKSIALNQRQILNSICYLTNQLKTIFDQNQKRKFPEQFIYQVKLQQIIKIEALEKQKGFNTSHEFYKLGYELFHEGQKDVAFNFFKLDIQTNPYHLKSYTILSQQLRVQEKYSIAKKYLKHMETYLKQNPIKKFKMKIKQKDDYLEFFLEQGIVLGHLQKYEESLSCFEEVIKLNPKFPKVQNYKGIVLHKLKRYNQALTCYDLEMQEDLNNIEAYEGKGFALERMGKEILALSCFEKILEIDENFHKAFIYKGIMLLKLDKKDEAVEQFFHLLNLCSNDAEECYKIGNLLQQNKVYGWAVKFYDQSIQHNDNNPDYFLQKGNSLQLLHMYQKAILCYDEAIQLDPCNSEFYMRKGTCLNLIQKFQEAIRCFNQEILLHPTNVNAHNLKGNILRSQKKYSEAIQCYDAALYIQPNNHQYLQNKSIAVEKLLEQNHAMQGF